MHRSRKAPRHRQLRGGAVVPPIHPDLPKVVRCSRMLMLICTYSCRSSWLAQSLISFLVFLGARAERCCRLCVARRSELIPLRLLTERSYLAQFLRNVPRSHQGVSGRFVCVVSGKFGDVVGTNRGRRLVVGSVSWLLTGCMTELPLVRAPRIPVTDTFHGVDVTEDYRWLEDASADETVAWTRAQQDRSATYFGEIGWRTALRARVEQLLKFEKTAYLQLRPGGGTFFALKVQTPPQQPFLVALTDLGDAASERGARGARLDLAGRFADERIAEHRLSASPDGHWVMDRVQRGDSGEWQVFLRGQEASGSWWLVADVSGKCVRAVLGPHALYLLSLRDAPRGRVLRLSLTSGGTIAGAEEIVPAGHTVIADLAVTGDTVWVVDMDGGPQQVRAFDGQGAPLAGVEIPPMSSVSSHYAGLVALGPDLIAWPRESFTEPATWC